MMGVGYGEWMEKGGSKEMRDMCYFCDNGVMRHCYIRLPNSILERSSNNDENSHEITSYTQ